MTAVLQIVLCSDSVRQTQTWADALRSLSSQVCTYADLPAGIVADLLITDRSLTDEELIVGGGECGLVAVGLDTAADVSLPADATARELRLTCSLLGRIVGLRRQRSEELRQRQLLNHQAFSDPLTGLPNRRAFDAEVARRLQAIGREHHNLCLILIDLDRFKCVNDSQGHNEGDRVLKQTGEALSASVRDHDLVARLGGDEFVVLISSLAADSALRVVERIRASVGQALQNGTTATAGFALVTQSVTPLVLFEAADQALLAAKAEGRDRTEQSSCEPSREDSGQ